MSHKGKKKLIECVLAMPKKTECNTERTALTKVEYVLTDTTTEIFPRKTARSCCLSALIYEQCVGHKSAVVLRNSFKDVNSSQ